MLFFLFWLFFVFGGFALRRKSPKSSGDIAHDFWILEEAQLQEDGTTFSAKAIRLSDAVQSELTNAGELLTIKGFSEFFESSDCTVTFAEFKGEHLHLLVERPGANHACLSSEVAGAMVKDSEGTLSLSIELAEYVSEETWKVFAPFLDTAEEKLESSFATAIGDMQTNGTDEFSWLFEGCDTLGCAGSLISTALILGLVEALESRDPEDLAKWLVLNVTQSSLVQLESFESVSQSEPNEGDDKVRKQVTLQGLSASAGARVGIASVFHVLERVKLDQARVEVAEHNSRSWFRYFNPSLYKGGLPTFYTRLNFRDARLGLGLQSAWPATFGVAFPLLRDHFHNRLHPEREEYSVDSSIFASVTAAGLTHPFTVMSARRNLGVQGSKELLRHVHRGVVPSGVASFLWGAAYGTTRAAFFAGLGQERAQQPDVQLGIDVLGSAAGIAISAPMSYVAMQQYVHPGERVPLKDVFKGLFTQTLKSDVPLRQLMKTLDMTNRLKWGVPRFALTQLAMKSLLKLQDEID